MRVLFLCYRGNPYCGGQGIYLYYLSRELAKMGVEIDVLVGPPYPDNIEDWAEVYKTESLNLFMSKTLLLPYEKLARLYSPWNFIDYFLTRLHIFPEMETFSFRAFSALKKLLKRKKYDLIHDIQCLAWGLLPMKGFGIPIITTVHHPLTQDLKAGLSNDRTLWDMTTTILFYPIMMQKFVINRLDRVITSSYEVAGELSRTFGLKAEKISVVYNGMDVEAFRNNGEKREDRELLFVGNTEDSKKGVKYLLEAMKLLPEDIKLTIVDAGPPYKLTATDMIQKMGLENRVSLTGKVDIKELVSLYCKKTIVVMPSLYEGFGLPATEAMACETPVVATSAGALKEVVKDGTGILVPPKDPAALKDAIMKLLNNKDLRVQMGKKGRKWTEENFAWPMATRNTLAVYKEVIEQYKQSR